MHELVTTESVAELKEVLAKYDEPIRKELLLYVKLFSILFPISKIIYSECFCILIVYLFGCS